jgi:acetylglutamate kinase
MTSRLVVKVGGAQLEEKEARAHFARAVARAREDGHQVVVVHGGGDQIRSFAERLALPQSYRDGLRVTDAATAEVVTAVLAGLVNKHLVAELGAAGVPAVGLCGADASCLQVERHAPAGHDLGYVGAVCRVDTALLEQLLRAGYVPVVATVAPLAPDAEGARDHLYNVNADLAAGPLARALAADALLFLTDVPGVLDEGRRLVARLSRAEADRLRAGGVLEGGMVPKVAAAQAALGTGVPHVVAIASAAGEDAVRAALAPGAGTRFTT